MTVGTNALLEERSRTLDRLNGLLATVQHTATEQKSAIDKMVAAKNFQSGLATVRQVEMGLFDMRIHGEPGADQRVQHVLDEVRREVEHDRRLVRAAVHAELDGAEHGLYPAE